MPAPYTPEPAAIALTPAPDAPAGSSDPTRRWALAFPDGATRFAGVARPEAEAALEGLARAGDGRWDRALVEISLPVVLADGAGPYLLDAAGRITLALGPHPSLAGALVAMGQPTPAHRVGLVRRREGRVWEWVVDAMVATERRVAALDELDAATDLDAALRWQARTRRGRG